MKFYFFFYFCSSLTLKKKGGGKTKTQQTQYKHPWETGCERKKPKGIYTLKQLLDVVSVELSLARQGSASYLLGR